MRRTVVIAVLIAALAVVGACSLDGGLRLPTGVIYPRITPDDSVTDDPTITYEFMFESKARVVSVTVDGAVYAGADAAQKSVTRFGNARENDWIEDYYPAFVNEPNQDAFYDALSAEFRAIRDADSLDSARYAELMTVFVQSIEYRTDPVDLSPKFPVETFVEQSGDCDDKALLLAGLLSHEGYDVAVMLFEAEEHVALGIRSDDGGYMDTGYDFIETTAPGFVGMVPDGLGGGISLSSEPRVFQVDGGTIRFAASDEVSYILDEDVRLETSIIELGDAVKAADAELTTLQAEADSLKAQLDTYSASGSTGRYNALVPRYNDAVDEYNDAVRERNELAARYNDAVDRRAYIYDHLGDRPAVYRFLLG